MIQKTDVGLSKCQRQKEEENDNLLKQLQSKTIIF
jgi:hypothetical protein